MKMIIARQLIVATFCLFLVRANSAEFEKLGKAVAKVLGTKEAYRTTVKRKSGKTDVFYSKGKGGRAKRLAVVERGVYEPNCTHTWVVGIDVKKTKVTDVRVVEMSCPHAFPTRKPAFLGQFKGKGKPQLKTLTENVDVVAKATGSSELASKAVRNAIIAALKLKGKI